MRLSFYVLAVLLSFAPSSSAAQSDSSAVVATLDRFLRALYARDTAAMKAEFEPEARMTLLRPDPAGGMRVVALNADGFVKAATNPNGPALDEPLRNLIVLIDGDLASVWGEYQVRVQGRVSHCGYDAFHLVRRGGVWRILNVSDTFRREGCGAPWTSSAIDPSRIPR